MLKLVQNLSWLVINFTNLFFCNIVFKFCKLTCLCDYLVFMNSLFYNKNVTIGNAVVLFIVTFK